MKWPSVDWGLSHISSYELTEWWALHQLEAEESRPAEDVIDHAALPEDDEPEPEDDAST